MKLERKTIRYQIINGAVSVVLLQLMFFFWKSAFRAGWDDAVVLFNMIVTFAIFRSAARQAK